MVVAESRRLNNLDSGRREDGEGWSRQTLSLQGVSS